MELKRNIVPALIAGMIVLGFIIANLSTILQYALAAYDWLVWQKLGYETIEVVEEVTDWIYFLEDKGL